MPYPCSHFYFDINFGDRSYVFKREEARLSSSLLNTICYQILSSTLIRNMCVKNLSNFVSFSWNLDNPYYHSDCVTFTNGAFWYHQANFPQWSELKKLRFTYTNSNANFANATFQKVPIPYLTRTKGQLISKCLFGVFNFLQKMNENKSTWGFIVVK